jgi:microcystin degradation protein MlrC
MGRLKKACNLCKKMAVFYSILNFKKMKKYFIGLAIAAVAVGTFAFAPNKNESKKVLNSWYEYRSTSQDASDLTNENLYFLVSAPSGCSSDENICAVNVPGGGQHPANFSATIEQDILDAVANKAPVSGYIEMKP